ncbi:aldehyde dehydrogenase family protein, partial [Escherichia coli]|nr:aldehyde dehydrogenase family protein [Escherichia coli]
VKRILCVEAVADDFSALVLKKARMLKCGDPMDPTVDVGTVIHEGAAKEFERRVNAAVTDGAELLHGNDRQGALYPPTVVDRIPWTSELV